MGTDEIIKQNGKLINNLKSQVSTYYRCTADIS